MEQRVLIFIGMYYSVNLSIVPPQRTVAFRKNIILAATTWAAGGSAGPSVPRGWTEDRGRAPWLPPSQFEILQRLL